MPYLQLQNTRGDDGKTAAWFNIPAAVPELWIDYEFQVQGPPPEPMAAGMKWKGVWNDQQAYDKGDVVFHLVGSWQTLYPTPAGVSPTSPVRPADSTVRTGLHGLDVMASDRLAASNWVYKKITTTSDVSDDTGHKAALSMIDMSAETAFQVNIANDHPTSALEVRVYDESGAAKGSFSVAAGATSGNLALGTTTPATPTFFDRFIFCSFADDSAGRYRIKIVPTTSMNVLTNPPSLNTFMANVHSVRAWTYNRINWSTPKSVHISNEADLTDLSGRPAVAVVADRIISSQHDFTFKNNHPSQNLTVNFYDNTLGALGTLTPNPIAPGATGTFSSDTASTDIYAIAYFGSGGADLIPGDFDVSITNPQLLPAPPAKVNENLEWNFLTTDDLAPAAPFLFEFYRDPFNVNSIPTNRLVGRTALGVAAGGFSWELEVCNVFDDDGFVGVGATYLARLHLVHVGSTSTKDLWQGTLTVDGVLVHNISGAINKPVPSIKSFVLRPKNGARANLIQINWIRAGTAVGDNDIFKADYSAGDKFP